MPTHCLRILLILTAAFFAVVQTSYAFSDTDAPISKVVADLEDDTEHDNERNEIDSGGLEAPRFDIKNQFVADAEPFLFSNTRRDLFPEQRGPPLG